MMQTKEWKAYLQTDAKKVMSITADERQYAKCPEDDSRYEKPAAIFVNRRNVEKPQASLN